MMIILYTSISIVFLAFILCLIIRFNNNRKENIKNTVKQAFWNDCNKHSLLLFHLMVDKLNVQEEFQIFTFDDKNVTSFSLVPEAGKSSSSHRIHITEVTWTVP